MANKHLYIGIENLALTNEQRETLIDGFKALGPHDGVWPPHNCHWRIRLDNQAIMLEALWPEEKLTIANLKAWLGQIFGVDPDTINHSVQFPTFNEKPSPLVTFSRAGIDYIRFVVFGDLNATWKQSLAEWHAYCTLHRTEWEKTLGTEEIVQMPTEAAAIAAGPEQGKPSDSRNLWKRLADWARGIVE